MDKRNLQGIARFGLPVIVAAAVLILGLAALNALWTSGNGDYMIWFWPAVAGVAVVVWLALRNTSGAWFSPRVLAAACVPVLVLLLSAHVLLPYLSMPAAAGTDKKAVDLSADLYTVDGKSASLEDFSGKLLFINFWATWCGPCRAEMPSMADLHHKLANQGLWIVAITDEDPETVQAYLEGEPYPFTILLDPKGVLFQRLRVRALPTTLVVNSERRIVLEHEGAYFWNTPQMVDEFRRLLSE